MLRSLSIIACSLLVFTACNTPETKQETATETPAPKEKPSSNLIEEGTTQMMHLLSDYYALKDALVASDAAKTADAAKSLQTSSDSLSHFLGDSSQNLTKHTQEIKIHIEKVISGGADVEKQRIPFEKISDAVYALVKDANLKNAAIYRQYCPMAFNDKGAYWLSSEEKIRNPYFGKKMLTCGEVTDTLK